MEFFGEGGVSSASGFMSYEFRFLKNLNKFIYKLFMEIPFVPGDFNLTEYEKTIIIQLLKKKKYTRNKKIIFTPEYFNKISKRPLQKKKEDCLKFIFNKIIAYLKQKYREDHLKQRGNLSKNKFNVSFYEHYFGKIAREKEIPLKCFYDYSLYNKTKDSLIPKSISKKYIKRIKMNPDFVAKITFYLENKFLKWFSDFNSKKIKKKVFQWEQLMREVGEERGLKTIVTRINSRNNKLFWTLRETQSAINISLNCLAFT
jgi:hypothetical protein